ncbi:MAG: hypothetical protein HY770_04540 [Chitinivibrionia bacterium]|nr:hypothetical protein [Chitinivibrionia bacterium]
MLKLKMVFLCLAAVVLLPSASLADNALAGYDLLQTVPGLTYRHFSGPFAIPGGFFDPGSDPFEGTVALRGEPLPGFSECSSFPLGNVDTIVRRKTDAFVPIPPATDVIPIELVALSLVSVAPITITYSAGSPELWNLEVTLSRAVPSAGTMTINHSYANGGTFSSTLYVYPVITFTRISPPDFAVRVFDTGQYGLPDQLSVANVPWVHTPGSLACTSCSVNFVPGIVEPTPITWTLAGPFAAHAVQSPCTQTVPVENCTWGYIRSLYGE